MLQRGLFEALWDWLDRKPGLKSLTMISGILGVPLGITGIVFCFITSAPPIVQEGNTYVFPAIEPMPHAELQAIPKSDTARTPQPTLAPTQTPLPDRRTVTTSPTATPRPTRRAETASPETRTELTQRLNAGGDDRHYTTLAIDGVHYREHGIAMLAAKSVSKDPERTRGLRYVALCAADADDSDIARQAAGLVVDEATKTNILDEVRAIEAGSEVPFLCGLEAT